MFRAPRGHTHSSWSSIPGVTPFAPALSRKVWPSKGSRFSASRTARFISTTIGTRTRSSTLSTGNDLRWQLSPSEKKGREQEYLFHELSDGQRVLFGLYAVLHYAMHEETTVSFDEPDNFVSLREIDPWLQSVGERAAVTKFSGLRSFCSWRPWADVHTFTESRFAGVAENRLKPAPARPGTDFRSPCGIQSPDAVDRTRRWHQARPWVLCQRQDPPTRNREAISRLGNGGSLRW